MITVCPKCHVELEIDEKFSGKRGRCECGEVFTVELKKCPYCGEMVKCEAVKCRFCQSMLDGTPTGSKRIVYGLLCLFFGMIGIHNYYAGKRVSGLLKLALFIPAIFLLRYHTIIYCLLGVILLAIDLLWCFIDLALGMPKNNNRLG